MSLAPGAPLEQNNQSIVIDGEYIKAVGGNPGKASRAELIDASGKYLCPGFIDAHSHIGLEEEIYRIEGSDTNESTHPLTPEMRAVDGINFWDIAFSDALAGGVTRSMVVPGSANVLGGQGVILKHLAASPSRMIYKDRCGVKAAFGENPKRVYGEQKKSPATRMANASLLRERLFTASRLMEKDDLEPDKIYQNEMLFAVLRREIPVYLHAHRADDILTALRISKEFDIELVIQHGTEAHLVADELVEAGVPVFLGPLLSNRAKVELKEISFKNAARLAQKGVQFCIITDHPVIPVDSLRVCAALAVREGLDERIALEAISLNAARLLKIDGELGSIEAGKRADLVVLSGHPFDYRSRVEKVIVDGMLLDIASGQGCSSDI